MSDPIRIALVAEGPTDGIVIGAAIGSILGTKPFILKQLQPEESLAFGQLQSATLTYLASLAPGLRMTPWRMIFLEGLREMPVQEGLVTRGYDPMLRVIACTGAPGCPEAHAETRTLAASLAPHISEDATLHVSGCAKGCAHPGSSEVTLVGAADGYDLVRHGSPRDVPAMRGLTPAQLLADISVLTGVR